MFETLGVIWPMAVGAAISPTITAITLALLAAGRVRVYAFWLGAALSLGVWSLIVSSFMWGLIQSAAKDIDRYSDFLDLGLGMLLVIVGIVRFTHRHRPPPARRRLDFRSLAEGPYWRQIAFGAVMQGRNVTTVLLFCAAQQHIDVAQIPFWQRVVLTVLVIGIATASIWLPLVIPRSVIARFAAWTEPTQGWIARNARVIEVVAAIGFGGYLIVDGLVHLS